MPRTLNLFYRLLLIIVLTAPGIRAQNQSAYQRFQYHHLKWRAYHTTLFHVYFPEGYDSLTATVAREFLHATALVKTRMNTPIQQVPNIIIYPSIDQLYESNVGRSLPNDITLPTFISKGTRLLLYFDGSHTSFRQQLITGLVRATWESQLEEGLAVQASGKDIVPYWVKEGMIHYFANQWTVDDEAALRRNLAIDSAGSWQMVIARQPVLAGAAFNYFLYHEYYKQAPAGLYFQLRKRKPWQRALRLITKTPHDSLFNQCYQFYRQRFFSNSDADTIEVTKSVKPISWPVNGRLTSMTVSPKGDAFAYTVSTWHKRTMYIYEVASGQRRKLFSYFLPPWLNDHKDDPYPLLQWTDHGNELLAALTVDGTVRIQRYNRRGRKTGSVSLEGLDGVRAIRQTDASNYLLAAWDRAQSDIVTYSAGRNKYHPLTNDIYDDDEPVILPGNEILFSSNRPLTVGKDDSISMQGIFKLDGRRVAALVADTTPYVKWTTPVVLSDGRVSGTTTIHGVPQYALLSPVINKVPAQFYTNDGPGQYLKANDELLSWWVEKDSIRVARQPFAVWQQKHTAGQSASPWLDDYNSEAAERLKEDSILKAATSGEASFLDGVFNKAGNKAGSLKRADSIKASLQYNPLKSQPYVLQLYSAYFSAKVNNDYFFNRYQPDLNYQGLFKVPQPGGMAQGGFSDLFEHHHFNIAYRLPAGTEGSDFFIHYNNTAKRLDWGLSYYRKAEDLKPDPRRNWKDEEGRLYPGAAKVKTNYYELNLLYPLTYFSAIEGSLGMRHDKTVFLATEKYSLNFPSIKSLWSVLHLSYSLQHLQPTLRQLHKGYSLKGNVDAFKGFSQSEAALAGMGFQAEYHQPLYRYITMVSRLQAGYSGGRHRILYNMGGVENNITPRIDTSVHFSQEAPYSFQTLVSPFRGYYQNTLFGSSFAMLNLDVYFPVFETLIPLETALPSLNNLQIGLFADAAIVDGAAGYTAINRSRIAYGLSGRTILAGYPIRFDMAWPGNGGKPVWYLSLNVK